MRFLSRLLAFIPLSVHLAYAAATVHHLPARLGQTADSTGTDRLTCLIVWFCLVGLSNAAFVFLHMRMPKFKDDTLRLPGMKLGRTDPDLRAEFISKLRAVAETSLLSLNVFFLAVYQAVYQANTAHPVMQFQRAVLFVGFMIVPLFVVMVHIGLTVHRMGSETPPAADR